MRLTLESFLAELMEQDHRDWLAQIDAWRGRHPLEVHGQGPLPPQEVIRALYAVTEGQGILVRGHSYSGIAEEAPGSYKDVTEVVDAAHNAGLARKLVRLKPMACVKG